MVHRMPRKLSLREVKSEFKNRKRLKIDFFGADTHLQHLCIFVDGGMPMTFKVTEYIDYQP